MKRLLPVFVLFLFLIPLSCDHPVMEPESVSPELVVSEKDKIKVTEGVVVGPAPQFVVMSGIPGLPPDRQPRILFWEEGVPGSKDLTPPIPIAAGAPGTWSPNGQELAFFGRTGPPHDPEWNIYVMDVAADGSPDHTSVVQVSANRYLPSGQALHDQFPVWSPDGRKVAWLCVQDFRPIPGTTRWDTNESICYSERTSGVWGTPVVLTSDPTGPGIPSTTYYSEGIPTWSPSSDKLLFNRLARGCDQTTDCPFKSWDLFTVDISTKVVQNVTNTPHREEQEAAWNPTLRSSVPEIVFTMQEDNDEDDLYGGSLSSLGVATLLFSGPTTDREWYPFWTPDGKYITYTKHFAAGGSDVFIFDPKGGTDTNLTNTPSVFDMFATMRPPITP